MKFTHDFRDDLETLLHEIDHGEPFAFSRFGDGELALLQHRQVQAADGWQVPAEPTEFTVCLEWSLLYDDPRYYLGLGCGCDDAGCCDGVQQQLRELTRAPDERITSSNLFVNGNHARWRQYMGWPNYSKTSEFVLVGPWPMADVRVPVNGVNMRGVREYVTDEVIPALHRTARPILVCAGPLSNLIIAHYWLNTKSKHRQTIIDVGSAMETGLMLPAVHRGYQNPAHPNRTKMCRVLAAEEKPQPTPEPVEPAGAAEPEDDAIKIKSVYPSSYVNVHTDESGSYACEHYVRRSADRWSVWIDRKLVVCSLDDNTIEKLEAAYQAYLADNPRPQPEPHPVCMNCNHWRPGTGGEGVCTLLTTHSREEFGCNQFTPTKPTE